MHTKSSHLLIKCLLLFFVFSINTVSAQETGIRQKLVGSWIFYNLEYPKDMSAKEKKEAAKAASMNAGVMLIFSDDGKYKVSALQNNKRQVVASGIFKLSENDTYLKIEGLEGYIADLDKQYLKLFLPDKPLLVFRKN